MQGTAWTAAMKLIAQTVAWISTLGVARLLDPSDYGVFGMASLYLGLLQLVSEFGIGSAIVAQGDTIDKHRAKQLNTIAILIGLVGAAVLCATAPLVGAFFRTPALVPVLIALSASFIISSFRTVPFALLQRDLRYKQLAIYDAAQAIILAVCALALAALGARYWTLVVAALLSSTLSAAITLARHPVGFARPELDKVRNVVKVGGELVVQRIAWYGYSNADFLVAGRMLGQGAAGAYTLAWSLANVAIDKVGTTILQVTPGILARARHDPAELQRYTLRISETLMLVLAPITMGLAVVAPEFVRGVLGMKWVSIVPALQLLSLYATIRAIVPLFSQILMIQGAQRVATDLNVILLVVMPLVFWFGSRWGITGIALGWIAVYPIVAVTMLHRALSRIGLSKRKFARQVVWPAASACVLMALAVEGVRMAIFSEGWPILVRLALQVLTGMITYPLALLVFHRERVRALITSLRLLRGA